jgi:DNA/RNA-binding domain of Phe-tRNA-synthetase-like protein
MHFEHAAEIWHEFPELVAGAMFAEGIRPDVAASARTAPFLEAASARLASASEGELPEIQAWRRAYTRMGMKPTQYRCAAEALLRRYRRERTLPEIHPLIDICNAISLAFAIPIAVLDTDRVASFLQVRHATGTEEHLSFSGETEHPSPGEVIFADAANHAHARRWTHRQSRRSTVQPSTTRVLIVAEALHPTAARDIPHLLAAVHTELSTLWSADAPPTALSADQPRFSFTPTG